MRKVDSVIERKNGVFENGFGLFLSEVLFAELERRPSFVPLEEFDKIGSVVEMEEVGNFADAFLGVQNIPLGLQQELGGDVFARALLRVFSAGGVQVLGRGVKEDGKLAYGMQFRAFFRDQSQKTVVQQSRRGGCFFFYFRLLQHFGKDHPQVAVDQLVGKIGWMLVFFENVLKNEGNTVRFGEQYPYGVCEIPDEFDDRRFPDGVEELFLEKDDEAFGNSCELPVMNLP